MTHCLLTKQGKENLWQLQDSEHFCFIERVSQAKTIQTNRILN